MRSLFFFIILNTFGFGQVALAKQIYSWTDERGVKHYSDQPPPNSVPQKTVQKRLVDVDPKPVISLRQEMAPGVVRYFAYNALAAPASISLSIDGMVQTSPADLSLVELPAQREVPLFEARPLGQKAELSFQYRWAPGPPDAKPDANAVYQLPFKSYESYQVHQGFNGSFSHNTPESQYAVDIAMPLGTEVLAARAGVVMQVERDFFRAGNDISKFGERANFVSILHADGSIATYAHLDLESVIVGLGRRVQAGQKIARSGNTGFSTGPHLHFVIQYNDQGVLRSLPFVFSVDGRSQLPTTNAWLGQQR